MKIHWTMAMLLSAALFVGCGDRGTDNSKNLQENGVAPTAGTATVDNREGVPETSARVDDSAIRDAAPPARTQPRAARRPSVGNSTSQAASSRPSPAAPAEPIETHGTNVVAGTVDRPARNADAP